MQQKITVAGSGVRMTARKTTPGLDDRAHGVELGQSAADQLMPSGIGPVGFPSDPQEGAISDLFGSAGHRPAVKPLTVFHAELTGAEQASWEELFAGYTSLKAITFSSSVDMLLRFADRLDDMEVVFGSETILSKSIWRWRKRARPSKATALLTPWLIRRPWSRRSRAFSARAAVNFWNGW